MVIGPGVDKLLVLRWRSMLLAVCVAAMACAFGGCSQEASRNGKQVLRGLVGQPALPASVTAPPAGFDGAVGQAPQTGRWRVDIRYTMGRGVGTYYPGRRVARLWTIKGDCAHGPCTLQEHNREGDQSAPLRRGSHGWEADFGKSSTVCDPKTGDTWSSRLRLRLRFTAGGRHLQAHQANLSVGGRCGYGITRATVTGHRSDARDALGDDGPVADDAGPLNHITEAAMAASVGEVADRRTDVIADQLRQLLGAPVKLDIRVRLTDCRSRLHTATRRGLPFECIVSGPSDAGPAAVLIRIADVEGRCWRGAMGRVALGSRRIDLPQDVSDGLFAFTKLYGCA
ncbi:MAG TPA: hypothetical protein VL120_02040 [Solirubrobacteraceae bacterium]|jgi:hypothetical protein|nr:hypothetical protein [Solirubrobacteraceae bacterium]